MITLLNLPYQQNWLAIGDQYKFGLWARQTGKTTMIAEEIAGFGPSYKARVICPTMSSAKETAKTIAKHTVLEMRGRVDSNLLVGYSVGGRILVVSWREPMAWHEFMGSDIYADDFVFYTSDCFAKWLKGEISDFPKMRVRMLSSFQINHNLADFYQHLVNVDWVDKFVKWQMRSVDASQAAMDGVDWFDTTAMKTLPHWEYAQLYMNRPF